MSNFPWWNSTITVYNRSENTETQLITWKRTVLTNCFWKIHYGSGYLNSQATVAYDGVLTCRIPKNENFVDTYTWKTLDDIQKEDKFTLQNDDIVIYGEVDDEIDEYTKGKRSTDLLEKYKYKGVIKISLFVDNSDDTRNLMHYYVR